MNPILYKLVKHHFIKTNWGILNVLRSVACFCAMTSQGAFYYETSEIRHRQPRKIHVNNIPVEENIIC